MSVVGGTTWHAGALRGFGAKKVPKVTGVPPFDLEKAVKEAVAESNYTVNQALARATIIKCGEMVDWLFTEYARRQAAKVLQIELIHGELCLVQLGLNSDSLLPNI